VREALTLFLWVLLVAMIAFWVHDHSPNYHKLIHIEPTTTTQVGNG
jgi:hypothetical protein